MTDRPTVRLQLYRKRRAAGLCVKCEAPAPNGARCDDCARDWREAQRARRKQATDAGRCYICGEPVMRKWVAKTRSWRTLKICVSCVEYRRAERRAKKRG